MRLAQLANHSKEFLAAVLPVLQCVGDAKHECQVTVEHFVHELAPATLQLLSWNELVTGFVRKVVFSDMLCRITFMAI